MNAIKSRWKPFYEKEFTGICSETGKLINTNRSEWESAPCPIDMTQVTNEQMQEFADKLYLCKVTEEVMFDEAEEWLMANTKAKYIEDYSKDEAEKYRKRAQKLYYNN